MVDQSTSKLPNQEKKEEMVKLNKQKINLKSLEEEEASEEEVVEEDLEEVVVVPEVAENVE